MSNEKMRASFRMLMLITTPKLGEKALALFEREKLPMQCQAYAHGTASREMMDMLGLDSGEKSLLLSMMPKANADELLKQLRRELRLGASGSGIAFTIPLSGTNRRMLQMVEQICEEQHREPEKRRIDMRENEYQMIVALVNQGYSEDVMAAARPAGGGGRNGSAQPPHRGRGNAPAMGIQHPAGKGSGIDSGAQGRKAGDHAGDLR